MKVGARNEGMDVEPDTANTFRKVGVSRGRGLGGRIIAIVVLLITLFFVLYLLFVL